MRRGRRPSRCQAAVGSLQRCGQCLSVLSTPQSYPVAALTNAGCGGLRVIIPTLRFSVAGGSPSYHGGSTHRSVSRLARSSTLLSRCQCRQQAAAIPEGTPTFAARPTAHDKWSDSPYGASLLHPSVPPIEAENIRLRAALKKVEWEMDQLL